MNPDPLVTLAAAAEAGEANPIADDAPRQGARRRRSRSAVLGGTALILLLAAVAGTLPFSIAWYNLQRLDQVSRPPAWHGRVPYDDAAAHALRRAPGGTALSGLGPVVHAAADWMGRDVLGRSVLIRCLLGGALSLTIGLAAAAVAVSLGLAWGACAGLAGGRLDALMMRTVDVIYGLPYLLLVILLRVALDRPLTRMLGSPQASSVVILLLVIGATSWLTMARVVRGQVLTLRRQPFVEAALVSGAGPLRILRHHLLPHLLGTVVVYGAMIVPQAMLSESFLSFLGIGIQRPMPTWGSLAAEGLAAVNPVSSQWWLIVFPCVLLAATLLALNLLSDGLRDALDPRSAA
jgi:oligopeptide transport system permease protein